MGECFWLTRIVKSLLCKHDFRVIGIVDKGNEGTILYCSCKKCISSFRYESPLRYYEAYDIYKDDLI